MILRHMIIRLPALKTPPRLPKEEEEGVGGAPVEGGVPVEGGAPGEGEHAVAEQPKETVLQDQPGAESVAPTSPESATPASA
jgi:hypothetical protein